MTRRLQTRRPFWPAVCVAAAMGVVGGIAIPGVSAPAVAQLRGTLSGPSFAESAGLFARFEREAADLARTRSGREDIRAYAEKGAPTYDAMVSDLRAALARANGVITLPSALDGRHETMIERLKTARGTDFDALYVQAQIDALNAAAGVFGAYARDGDQSALKDFAEKHLPFLNRQLEAARNLQIKT